ncbi:MAG: hypothetical protein ACP5NL_00095 [Thermoplasmata archaeon]
MKSIKPLLKIEWKNHNFYLYLSINITIFLVLIMIIKMENNSLVTDCIQFSLITFIIFGLFWATSMLENLKNYKESGILKTYVSYPINTVQFVVSKQIPYLMCDLISLIVGSFAAFIIIGDLKFLSLELFLIATLFTLLSSRALFFLGSMMLRLGFLPEIIVIFYYVIVFFINYAQIGINTIFFTQFPYFYLFATFFSLNYTDVDILNLIAMPIIYLILIFLAMVSFKITNWKLLFNYK